MIQTEINRNCNFVSTELFPSKRSFAIISGKGEILKVCRYADIPIYKKSPQELIFFLKSLPFQFSVDIFSAFSKTSKTTR